MLVRESSREIDRAAGRWAARLDRGPLTLEEHRTLERWSAADPRRHGALARALAVLARCDALRTLPRVRPIGTRRRLTAVPRRAR